MTVLIKQRTPGPDTLERHDYTRKNVVKVKVYKALDKCVYLYLEDAEGNSIHYSLSCFDFEIQ